VAVLAILISAFVARVYAIPSGSMEQTLHGCPGCDNDRVLVDKLTYRFANPAPGDVVVFTLPATWTNPELEQTPLPTGLSLGLAKLGALLGVQAVGETDMIKRVIAVGGQTVACCDVRNRVTVDGRPLDEPFVYFAPEFGTSKQAPFAPVRVPDGQLWVMGDSRNNSVDSRAPGDGPVPLADVVGKARLIVAPLGRFGGIGSGQH
jgi:signal peptidase I